MSIHHQEPQGNTSEFNIEWILVTKTSETIKWKGCKDKCDLSQRSQDWIFQSCTASWAHLKNKPAGHSSKSGSHAKNKKNSKVDWQMPH
jgi:hypothetical protein